MLRDLTEREIRAMIKNYDRNGQTSGGKWSRSELVLELDRRKSTVYPPHHLAQIILRMCHVSYDRRVSYKELWLAHNEGPLPKGQNWVKPLTDGLAVLGAWCIDNDLPILSTLVVNDQKRELSDQAASNVWNYMKDKLPNVPLNAREFVEQQAVLSMEMPIGRLPIE